MTERVRIGTAVALLTRPPAQAALAAAALDELSGGRFTLGLGVGPVERNRDWFGIGADRPIRRMREYIACVKAAWASSPGEPANCDGEIYSIRNFSRRWPSSRDLTVMVGVVGSQSARSAAAVADGIIFNVLLPRSYVQASLAGPVAEGLERSGKRRSDIEIGGVLAVSVDDDAAVARYRARAQILTYTAVQYFGPIFEAAGFAVEANRARSALADGRPADAIECIPDAMVDAFCISGTPDDARQRVAAWGDLLDFAIIAPPAAFLPAEEAQQAFDNALRATTSR